MEDNVLKAKSRVKKISTVGNDLLKEIEWNLKDIFGFLNCSLKNHVFKLKVGDTCLNCSSYWGRGGGWRFYLNEEDQCDLSAKGCALRCVYSSTLSRLRGEALPPARRLSPGSGPNASCCV